MSLIPESYRHAFGDFASLEPQLAGARMMVLCQKGLKLNQGSILRLNGISVLAEVLSAVIRFKGVGLIDIDFQGNDPACIAD